ncbi:DUF2163 domain-containing protein [Sphingomonas sp. MMS24-J13]|uniref:DUF2163 domain-containing protein n=1 Tax=Sphingomonas sp. MMS24-J13 TaxID=3238686 RepID=UPI00384A79DB
MKAASPALATLLDSGADFQMADLWTLTLSGGAVVRWSGADIPLVANGNTYMLGPAIDRGSIAEKIGLEVGTLTMTITANADDRINGTPIIPFIAGRGLDGANVRLERAFLPDWSSAVTGTLLRFAGRVTSVGEIAGSSVELTVSSWMILLNVNMPPNLYQSACLHTVYDAGCALNADSFASAATVSGTPSRTAFASGLTGHNGEFAQGRVKFTSGANTGIARTVKSNDGAGNFMLISPLPAPLAAGDAFTAYKGCDLTSATCTSRFNNIAHFKGTPFCPVPETVL